MTCAIGPEVDVERPAAGAAATARLPQTDAERADAVREAIERAGLTLYKVSALTVEPRRADGPPGAVPHTLYRDIRAGQTPTLHQLAAISRVTREPLERWLALFGVDLSRLAALQMALHSGRTIPLASRTVGPSFTMGLRFGVRAGLRLERLIDIAPGEPLNRGRTGDTMTQPRHRYLSIGAGDQWLAPEIAPRSIVRVDQRQATPSRFGPRHGIYAVAHSHGVSCCYVEALSPTHIAIFGAAASSPRVCRTGHDAIILGRVDAELRVQHHGGFRADTSAGAPRMTGPIALPDRRHDTFGRFVRRSRALIGLTFREARALSAAVAAYGRDERFALSLGALSNYETMASAPGSAQAVFSLAAIYSTDFRDLLATGGVRAGPAVDAPPEPTPLITPAIADTLGLPQIGESDLYLWGSAQKRLDPRLDGAMVVAVDHHDRRLSGALASASAEPPLFMLRLDGDAYICCAASLHESCVVVHPSASLGIGPRCLPRDRVEVMGRVSAILRRVSR
jgi:hypothetical protein